MVYGKSDEHGATVVDGEVTEGDFFATVYTALGIDPATEHYVGIRPIKLAPDASRVVHEVLS
ncbi:MAG: DUF1501 domain-containing protein [Planctomycetales bacterium]